MKHSPWAQNLRKAKETSAIKRNNVTMSHFLKTKDECNINAMVNKISLFSIRSGCRPAPVGLPFLALMSPNPRPQSFEASGGRGGAREGWGTEPEVWGPTQSGRRRYPVLGGEPTGIQSTCRKRGACLRHDAGSSVGRGRHSSTLPGLRLHHPHVSFDPWEGGGALGWGWQTGPGTEGSGWVVGPEARPGRRPLTPACVGHGRLAPPSRKAKSVFSTLGSLGWDLPFPTSVTPPAP